MDNNILQTIEKSNKEFQKKLQDIGEIVVEGNIEPEKKATLVNDEGQVAEMPLGTLYDVNKTLVAENEKKLSPYKLNNKINLIVKNMIKNFYYMLLCREKNDYTVFVFTGNVSEATAALKDCIINRGECRGIHKTDDGAYEIWIYDEYEKEARVYYFFSCNNCIIQC